MQKKDFKMSKKGFTLAEVLIVIGIIGIIAQMTIPTLVQNVQEKTTVTALKKAYSTLSQAYTMAVQENGTPDNWGLTADAAGNQRVLDMLSPILNTTQNCGLGDGCFVNKNYKTLGNGDWGNKYTNHSVGKAQLADGSQILTVSYGSCTNIQGTSTALKNCCGWIGIDTNGSKNPNQLGVDFFAFYLTTSGIIPIGSQQETGIPFDDCKNLGMGYGCTAWVLYNENLDYLHCSGLDWATKTKCN